MSNWAGGVLTAAGRVLQAKVEAGTTALILTKIKLGDGTEGMDAVDNLTDLVGPKAVLGISSSVADGDHATITGVMLSTQLQAGFWCREWGLFATDPDAGEILYMVTIDAQPEWLPASTAAAQVSATYAMNIAVANATNIEVQIDPAGLVDVEMLENFVGVPGRSKAIALGTTGMLENLPAGWFLECTTAGTTGATTPVITTPTVGGTVNDGTVVWTIRKSASTQDLTAYLPLSGGAMTGDSIERSVSNRLLSLSSRTSGHAGAHLLVFGGEDNEVDITRNGFFQLIAQKKVSGTVSTSTLTGQPSGKLEWNGNDLGGAAIVASSFHGTDGYIKNAKGLIVQWGLTAFVPGDNTKKVDFPISFSGTNMYSAFFGVRSGMTNGQYVTYTYYDAGSMIVIPYPATTIGTTSIHWLVVGY